MGDKGLNLFGKCADECVHLLCPQDEECTSSSRGDS